MFVRQQLLWASVLVLGCSGAGVGTTTEGATMTATGSATTANASGGETGDDGEEGGEAGESGNGSADSANDSGNEESGGDSADSANDSDPTDPSAGETGNGESGGEPVDLEGSWLSEGENIAPVFLDPTAPAQLTRVEAQFDGTAYTVYADTVQGDSFTLTGTYVVDGCADGTTQHILLEQTAPVQASFEGLFAIDNSSTPAMMQYEVTQTGGVGFDPTLVPPTCDGGLGSSVPAGTDNVQIYERMP